MDIKVDKTTETVRNLRLARGLKQREVAVLAGLSTQTVQNVEVGRKTPDTATIKKLAKALNVSPGELL